MDEAVGVGVGLAERAHHAGGDGAGPPSAKASLRHRANLRLRLGSVATIYLKAYVFI
jgi:hypothetical protein